MPTAMQNDNDRQARMPRPEATRQQKPRRGRGAVAIVAAVGLVAFGLFAWNHWLTPVRYELDIDRDMLFAGSPDTARITAHGINRAGSVVPFLRVPLRGELLDGAALGRLVHGEHMLLFVSHGTGEGTVRLRITAGDWPFPLLAELRIAVPVASRHPRTPSRTRSST